MSKNNEKFEEKQVYSLYLNDGADQEDDYTLNYDQFDNVDPYNDDDHTATLQRSYVNAGPELEDDDTLNDQFYNTCNYDANDFTTINTNNEGVTYTIKQNAIEVACKLNDIATQNNTSEFFKVASRALEFQTPINVINACLEHCSLDALKKLVNVIHLLGGAIKSTNRSVTDLIKMVEEQILQKNSDVLVDQTYSSLSHFAQKNSDDLVDTYSSLSHFANNPMDTLQISEAFAREHNILGNSDEESFVVLAGDSPFNTVTE